MELPIDGGYINRRPLCCCRRKRMPNLADDTHFSSQSLLHSHHQHPSHPHPHSSPPRRRHLSTGAHDNLPFATAHGALCATNSIPALLLRLFPHRYPPTSPLHRRRPTSCPSRLRFRPPLHRHLPLIQPRTRKRGAR